MRWMVVVAAVLASCAPKPAPPVAPAPVAALSTLDQGWSDADRAAFYSTDQGSQLIKASWFAALTSSDGTPFAADGLARYGYLASPGGGTLPVGFVVNPSTGYLGMTCAACHTGAIRYRGQGWRIDGGRAHADFQGFLTDLTRELRATSADPVRFAAFAAKVGGANAAAAQTAAQTAALRGEFGAKVEEIGGFMDRSLPSPAWGPGRLDAFGMIFNRVTALDIDVPQNYRPADAPVRYPFLWNAAIQDRTQWDGAAFNGDYVKAMARNTGEVMGVFAHFHPVRIGAIVDYRDNSVSFLGLQRLEEKIRTLRPPAWPAAFGLDRSQLPRGEAVFDQACASCHAVRPSATVRGAWGTPICRVGTDPVMYRNALLGAQSGLLAGSPQFTRGGVLHAEDKKVDILANAVVGSLIGNVGIGNGLADAINHDIIDKLGPVAAVPPARWALPAECAAAPPPPAQRTAASGATPAAQKGLVVRETQGLYQMPPAGQGPGEAAYESRVLAGVWAVGPYLHNGSVPTLWALLTPPGARPKRFGLGGEFDPVNVGPVDEGPVFDTSLHGNGNDGHAYGTDLAEADRRALIEYLKTL